MSILNRPMTLDPDYDAAMQVIRDALENMRRVLIELGFLSYVELIDHLQAALSDDRTAFYRSVNGGGVWRNMGSIADLGGPQIEQALVSLADALRGAQLASKETLADADVYRHRLSREGAS
jgi:hypothetical protein